jgi:NAD-dependent SIR2 family protein deacetylase
MTKEYQCRKCGNIYKDEQSDKFVKTTMKRCPVCGSSEVGPSNIIRTKIKEFAKKIIK